MKIAALADIHGNYQALITVLEHVERWDPDLVLILGDIINRGPRSRDCLHLILDKAKHDGWKVISGNHEGYVLNFTDPSFSRNGLEFDLRKIIFWTYQTLTETEIQDVDKLPAELSLQAADQKLIRCLHASTAGERVGIYPDSTADELKGLVDLEADIFLVGHTHQPLVKTLQDTIIINAGSVGLPFDGDKRAAYAQISRTAGSWKVDITRIDYDLSAAIRDFEESGFLYEGGPLAELVLAEMKLGWPQLNHWFRRYKRAVLAGEIGLDQAVRDFLLNPSIEQIGTDIPMSYPKKGAE
jgi:putative phosphoesterase